MKHLLLPAILLCTLLSCKEKKLFEAVTASHSGISFANTITDTDSLNVLDVENIYNGGGVAVADFNNDGLSDLYFTGNAVSNKLYLNKGDLKFQDITDVSATSGEGRWCRGASVIDINNDGWMDIYVSVSLMGDSARLQNLLYMNQGLNANKLPVFKEEAAAYGLNDPSHSTMAAFFDYDNDGDLDMYLLVNQIVKSNYPNTFRPILKNGEHPSTGKLFRNDWNAALGHAYFTNVSREAGITIEGYGHGVNICDINRDGWKDIYVSNDFISNNILYINNGDGTFTDKVRDYFKHTAENAMGVDIVDINNDGLADVIEADMNPEDNYRKKMMLNTLGYLRYINNEKYGYQHQYVRNVLQLNQGPAPLANDSTGAPVFSDVSFYAGMAETDWSWTPLVADFDNDGYRDLIITNGFPKDVTDHDFLAYRNKSSMLSSKREILDQIPVVKIPNYAFRNNGALGFDNVTTDWGLDAISFSNGSVYTDLDNDGDLDIVMNNINDAAFLYRNNSKTGSKENSYLNVQLAGDTANRMGIGAWVEVYYDSSKMQVTEYTPYRGYLSSVSNNIHFGLGKAARVDSVVVRWPGNRVQRWVQPALNTTIKAAFRDAQPGAGLQPMMRTATRWFDDVTASVNINYVHRDSDFIDFNIQKLLPHKFSEYGPALAAGDVNGDGLDDLIVGGPAYQQAQVFLQGPDGRFEQRPLEPGTGAKLSEDAGILLFDADKDGDADLYVTSGSFEQPAGDKSYADRFYVNDGKGNFTLAANGIPAITTSKSCVRAADYDQDGDLDLFLGGRVLPRKYPQPVPSYILRNDSKDGQILFTDVSATVAPSLQNIGLICDALFTDFDGDGWQDLVLTGEWMPLKFLHNANGKFEDISAGSGINDQVGWWTGIVPGDFDNDGDIDFVAGNAGLNSYYRASTKYPVGLYAGDFDKNDGWDAVPSLYLKPTVLDKEKKEFTAHQREDILAEINGFRKRYHNYHVFAISPIPEMFPADKLKDAIQLHANQLASCIVINEGNGKFSIRQLPPQAQFSTLNGMITEDIDGDGNLDLVATSNEFGADVFNGRYDAMNGICLKGDGRGNFNPLSLAEGGILIPGSGRALATLRGANGKLLLAASQNKGPLKIFSQRKPSKFIPLSPDDTGYQLEYRNGKRVTRPATYGSSFYSQGSRFISVDSAQVRSVMVTGPKGSKRSLTL